MSLKRAEEYLENKGFLDHVIELEESTATVAMAAGNDHSAVKLTIPELEQVADANGWVDVCKETED